MMEFKVGQSIQHREGYLAGIITEHRTPPHPFRAGTMDCIRLFVTLDTSDRKCNSIHDTLTFNDFHGEFWKVI